MQHTNTRNALILIQSVPGKIAAGAATLTAGMGAAMATGPGASMVSGLSTLESDVKAVIAVLAVVVILFVGWAYLRRVR